MSHRSLIFCLFFSVGVFLVAGGVASAVVVSVPYVLPAGNTTTNTATITGAITSPISQSKTATTYAHGTIATHLGMDFDFASHAAAVNSISFDYSNPGAISFNDVSLRYSVLWVFNENVDTHNLKGTLLTPGDPGPVNPATGKFPVASHQVELNQGTAVATGMANYTVDFAVEPARDWATGADGTISVSAASNPHAISYGPSGYNVTYDYTSQMIVPMHVVKDISEGSIVGTATVDGLLTVPGSFSHTFHYLVGDANLDGITNVADLTLLLNNYNKNTGMSWQSGDFSGEGTVNVGDLTALLNNYNKSSPAGLEMSSFSTVPEPGTVAMLLGLALSLAGFGVWKRSC